MAVRPRPDGVILPDYAFPDAICVPWSDFTIRATLEALAGEISRQAGVVLICRDPDAARRFVAGQARPEHFGIVTGGFDSPWLRDHAPVALRAEGRLRYVRPLRHGTPRENDGRLFETVFPAAERITPLNLAAGNLVTGSGGLAVSTDGILEENGLEDPGPLLPMARMLGIHDWLIVPGFPDDLSRHSDCMLRFLGPDLAAICLRDDDPEARRASDACRDGLRKLRPEIRLLDLPAAAGPGGFNSPLNWIQLGQTLLLPDFGVEDPLARTRTARLRAAGFDGLSIPCATSGLGGALHCLTASVFAS
nr:agmatine deiminase family protein [Salipiger pentaromativorans]